MRFSCVSGLLLAELGLLGKPSGCTGDAPLASDAFKKVVGKTQKSCWMFNHMNKSGGQTVKGILTPWVKQNNLSVGLYDSPHWKNGTGFAKTFLDDEYTVTWGAYTEGLRPHGVASHCRWFTVFRHPISRLVSAYYFCQNRIRDPLCGAEILRADEADILTFAKHWTNFGLRQFASAFLLPEAVTNSRMAQQCPGCPGWFLLKSYVDEAHAMYSGHSDNNVPDAAMYELLDPVQELLSNHYAAVGILERYNSTLHLFNVALEMPGVDWPSAFDEYGVVNKDKLFHNDIEQAIDKVMTDATIKRYLHLDLLLYEHAVAVHTRQLEEYGLV